MPKKIFCLLGPTAAGKTQIALQLVKKFPFEIISVDSAMVYRGMDIGTAKPSTEELAVAPHHLIDICDPADPYSAGRFRKDALTIIEKILQTEKIPLLVGGTMLYFHVLQQGIAELPDANPIIRASIQQRAQQHGWEFLHAQLQRIDAVAAARIHANDSQRIARALEVYELTGKSLTEITQAENSKPLPYQIINFAIAPAQRTVLHERIQKRFAAMLQQGFLEEVEKLYCRGDLNPDLPSIRTVGYRQAWQYLAGNYDFETMHENALTATRQLAKRQLTWLRSWENLQWLDSGEEYLEKLLAFLDLEIIK